MVIRLAFTPCLVETIIVGISSRILFKYALQYEFPWLWGFLLGFVLAAVSPAVVVPSLLELQEKGYGVSKGIPTLVIAAASVDDVQDFIFRFIELLQIRSPVPVVSNTDHGEDVALDAARRTQTPFIENVETLRGSDRQAKLDPRCRHTGPTLGMNRHRGQ